MGVMSMAIFGSEARDKARPEGDVTSLWRFKCLLPSTLDLKFFLEDLLGWPVDLAIRKSLSHGSRHIESEAQYVQRLSALP
jgi:predicted nucleotidyltransferase